MDLMPADTGETCDANDITELTFCDAPATWYDADSGFYYCGEHKPEPSEKEPR